MSMHGKWVICAALATALSGLTTSAHAQALSIDHEPPYVTGRAKPGFILGVDDSGSMNWETLFANQDGEAFWNQGARSFYQADGRIQGAGDNQYLELFNYPERTTPRRTFPPIINFGFARSSEFNPAYFNPLIEFKPWSNSDTTRWPDAVPSSAMVDPRETTGRRFDLTQNVRTDGTNWRFDFRVNMTVPAGTTYYRRTGGCNFGGTNDSWVTLTANVLATANCDAAVEYFPATFYSASATIPGYGYTATPVATVNPIGGPPNTTLYRYEIKPGNFAISADYDRAIQNFANWFQYSRDRNLSMISAMTESMLEMNFMRAGYFTINQRNTVAMRDLAVASEKAALYSSFFSLPANGSTPNRFAVDHMGNQFRRTDGNAPVQLACQVNAGMLFTDGYSNQGSPSATNDDGTLGAPFADGFSGKMSDIVASHYTGNIRPDLPTGLVPIPTECSDLTADNRRLDCNSNPHMKFYGITLGAIGNIYGVNTAATADPYANPPAWAARVDNDESAVDEIWQATLTGRGRYINASNPARIVNAMDEVLAAIQESISLSAGSLAVQGARINAESVTYIPTFSVSGDGRDWSGELRAYEVTDTANLGALKWRASNNMPAHNLRNVVATTTPGTNVTRVVKPFIPANLGPTPNDQAVAIGTTLAAIQARYGATTTVQQVIDYLRGDSTFEVRNGGVFRDRKTSTIGDIINTQPVVSSKMDVNRWINLSGALGTSYATYVQNKQATRQSMVYVPTNAGYLHGFNATTGKEEFAFIPEPARKNMSLLPVIKYDHRYFVDGELTVSDVYINSGWKTVLTGSTGRGGKSVFALDVSNPTSFSSGDVLWELGAADPDLGEAMSKVNIMLGEDDGWYAVFGNGINSTNSNPVLIIVNLATGVVTKRLTAQDNGNFTNGLLNMSMVDTNNNGKIDTVYGGDNLGNVWKFDLSATSNASWNVAYGNKPVFTAKDATNTAQPISGGFEVSRGPGNGFMLYFGTGRLITPQDGETTSATQVQTLYAVRDGGTNSLTRANLQAQTLTATRTISATAVDYLTKSGWYVDLSPGGAKNGERFIGRPKIQNGVTFWVTFEPTGDACRPGGKNWLYGLGPLSGSGMLGNGMLLNGPSGCTTGCSSVGYSLGAPVREVDFVRLPSPCRPGIDPGCPVPAACDPNDPGYDPANPACPGAGGGPNPAVCVIGIPPQEAGGTSVQFQVPCGRQSWRQVR